MGHKGTARKDYLPSELDTLGQRLKAARIKANITQEQVANALNVSISLVGFWEADTLPSPRVDQVKAMAQMFNAPASWLMFGEGEFIVSYGYSANDLRTYLSVWRVQRAYSNNPKEIEQIGNAIAWAEEALEQGRYD